MRGIVENMIFLMVVVVIVAISLIVIISFLSPLSTSLQNAGLVNESYMTPTANALGTFNGSMIFIVVGFICAMIIAAVTINAHPVFAVGMIIMAIFIVLLGGIMSNLFSTVASESTFSVGAAAMPETGYMFSHLPLIVLIGCIVVIIAMYSKGGGQP